MMADLNGNHAPATSPAAARISVIDGSAGVRMLIATLIKAGYPNAVIEDVDPYSQTLRGSGFTFDTQSDIIILGGLGTLNEALDALRRLRSRDRCAPVIVLCPDELSRLQDQLRTAGAFAVLRKDALSAVRLHRAMERVLSAAASTASTASTELPAPAYGEFAFVQDGEQCVVEIDGYRCLDRLPKGKLAQVFFAEQLTTRKRVVIKILTAGQVHNLAAMRAVCVRRKWLDHSRSPHMVDRLDTGIAGAFSYVVMEYLSSGDLRQRMKTPLDRAAALTIMAGLLDALAALHAGGLAHADLKPESIFFRESGGVVLIDFDIATPFGKSVTAAVAAAAPGDRLTALGTPNYSSPEQGAGLPIDATADVYSAGIIFVELLTGEVPFTGDTPAQVVFRHMHDEIPLLPLPLRHLQSLVDNMLAKDPADRYQSAGDARRALQRYRSTGQESAAS